MSRPRHTTSPEALAKVAAYQERRNKTHRPSEICNVPGCGLPQRARGLCNAHLIQYYKNGLFAEYLDEPNKFRRRANTSNATCATDGCDGKADRRGYCWTHYNDLLKNRQVATDGEIIYKTCKVTGCHEPQMYGVLCKRHHLLARLGDPTDPETQEAKRLADFSVDIEGKYNLKESHNYKKLLRNTA